MAQLSEGGTIAVNSLYFFPFEMRLVLCVFALAAVVIQSCTLLFSLWRYKQNPMQKIEDALEAAMLAQAFLYVLLIASIQDGVARALFLVKPFFFPRYLVFVAITLLSLFLAVRQQTPWPLLRILLLTPALPIAESVFPGAFPFLHILALLSFLLHSVVLCISRRRTLTTNISTLSVQEAIDQLHTGILFCDPDGTIALVNQRMRQLLATLSGDVYYSGARFDQMLTDGDVLPGIKRTAFGNQVIFRMPDQSSWMFTENSILIGKQSYMQLAAVDVTERWSITAALREQDSQLQKRRAELRKTLINLNEIQRDKELLRARTEVHDVMGQRLTMLLRILREEEAPNPAFLTSFTKNLFEELVDNIADSPARQLHSMVEMFRSIDVQVLFTGDSIEKAQYADIFADIIREAVTNAVKHGFANEVQVYFENTLRHSLLRIRDNGIPPTGLIAEGGGIGGMRQKLEQVGGNLTISLSPHFTLEAHIEKGGEQT